MFFPKFNSVFMAVCLSFPTILFLTGKRIQEIYQISHISIRLTSFWIVFSCIRESIGIMAINVLPVIHGEPDLNGFGYVFLL